MSYPRHEAELDRRSLRNCLHIFDRPSEIPSLLRSSWHQTRDYYAARDALDLERAELIHIISYSRTMGIKLFGVALFLGLLVILLVSRPCKAG